jgi:predicted alpha/beta-fold hydrolase
LAINYLEHVGTQSPFVAAASISNGYDILKGTTILRGKDAVCDGVVTQFIKDILMQGRLDESIQLAKAADIDIDFDAVMRCKSLQELEKLLVVPAYGYASLEEYYNDDTCHTKIGNVKSPLLCIANKKDPLIDVAVLEVPIEASKSNDHIMFVLTEHGGHVGWVEDLDSDPWYIRVYFEYIDALAM